jgi:hypothetical protein
VTVGMDGSTTWLPISEAASRLGLTVDGLRSRIRRGLVTTRKGNDGRLLVPVSMDGPATGPDPVMNASSPATNHPEAALAGENSSETFSLSVQVARLEERLAAAADIRAAIEARAQGAVDAAALAARAEVEAMRQQLETEVAARNAVIETLREEVQHERSERAKLADALADARKGWLERVLEAVRRR